jgi:hypothetical protein
MVRTSNAQADRSDGIGPILSVQAELADLILTVHPATDLLGLKFVENRSWDTDHRGRLWIHASGKHPSLPTGVILGHVELVETVKVETELRGKSKYLYVQDHVWQRVVDFAAARGLPDENDDSWNHVDSPDGSPLYWWLLANPVRLRQPIAAKGKLRLWHHVATRGN